MSSSGLKLNSPAPPSQARFRIPKLSDQKDIHEIINTTKSIYKELKSMNAQENESQNVAWLEEAERYLDAYNKNIDSILE
jgi:hypothetical protein